MKGFNTVYRKPTVTNRWTSWEILYDYGVRGVVKLIESFLPTPRTNHRKNFDEGSTKSMS